MVEPFVSNVLSNKYDTALDFHITMYDELPYQRDADYCGREQIMMHSKKLLKCYMYMFEDVSIIDNGDDNMESYLLELQQNAGSQAKLSGSVHRKKEKHKEEVTDEQIKTLLDDNDAPASTDTEPAEYVDPFAGVEDW